MLPGVRPAGSKKEFEVDLALLIDPSFPILDDDKSWWDKTMGEDIRYDFKKQYLYQLFRIFSMHK